MPVLLVSDPTESSEIPRKGSVMYSIVKGNKEEASKAIKRFKFWNKWFVIPLYRINLLPLFGIGFIFVLVYHIGRKSGKQYLTPLEYRTRNGDIYLFASRGKKTDWYRNMQANPGQVRIKKGFRKFQPDLDFLGEVSEKIEVLRWYITKWPAAGKFLFGWDKNKDNTDDQTLEPLAEFIQIIRVKR